ncbi:hypothetical protein ECHLIB_0935 [Ehrlichia chaffeensis str. Liberty]|uniref:hypothetical protein n=1 Tax=Ehrlichia chaffeensis TaxID=945 RepID=UPI000444CFF0|nr:hypothetical protein [Ehrlichia chaffeensis]AHX05979.1 hypothetical protein ECHJAX_0932 [Ehrlichia chaffeensis str. Jax]AHX06969.1 hypothetical protein ECHLIB_0935 [Ehrlichia chaffeensis str. Liberty]
MIGGNTQTPNDYVPIRRHQLSHNSIKSLTKKLFLLNTSIGIVSVIHASFLIMLFDAMCLQKKPKHTILTLAALIAVISVVSLLLFYVRYTVSKKNKRHLESMHANAESFVSLLQDRQLLDNLSHKVHHLQHLAHELESIDEKGVFIEHASQRISASRVDVEKQLRNFVKHCEDDLSKMYRELEGVTVDMSEVSGILLNPSFFKENEAGLMSLSERCKLMSQKEHEINLLMKGYCSEILAKIVCIIEMMKLHQSSSVENKKVSLFSEDDSKVKKLIRILVNTKCVLEELDGEEIKYPTFEMLCNVMWNIDSFLSSMRCMAKESVYKKAENLIQEKGKQVQRFISGILSAVRKLDVVKQEQGSEATSSEHTMSEEDSIVALRLVQLQSIILKLLFIMQRNKSYDIHTETCSENSNGPIDSEENPDFAVQNLQSVSCSGIMLT